MIEEMRMQGLGVISDAVLPLGAGFTAITGETGAGKTLLIGALSLLLGGRADPSVVRAGADEAYVEGRFVDDDGGDEVVLTVLYNIWNILNSSGLTIPHMVVKITRTY